MNDRDNQLKIAILNEICNSEPFFVLIDIINWTSKSERERFIKVLCELVDSDYLNCKMWYGKTTSESNLFDCLFSYVDKRLEMGEKLNEVSNIYEEYDFTLTEKGKKWLQSQER